MRISSLEIEVFELTPAVAVTRSHRSYEDEEEGPEEEESEEEEPEGDEEENEPAEMLWRSSASVRRRDASDSVSGEGASPGQLGLRFYARLLNRPPSWAMARVLHGTIENQTLPWPGHHSGEK